MSFDKKLRSQAKMSHTLSHTGMSHTVCDILYASETCCQWQKRYFKSWLQEIKAF